MSVEQILRSMAETFAEKGKVYGNDLDCNGKALQSLFPHGLWLRSPDDFNRFATFALMMVKMSRYAVNFEAGGHQDSVHDLAVYAAILEHLDAEAKPIRYEINEEQLSSHTMTGFIPPEEGSEL